MNDNNDLLQPTTSDAELIKFGSSLLAAECPIVCMQTLQIVLLTNIMVLKKR
jgi:hypothetical protein